MAIFEAATMLRTSRYSDILVLMSEEPLGAVYAPYFSEQQLPYAIALMLSDREGTPMSTWFESISAARRDLPPLPLALQFLKWLINETPTLRTEGKNYAWSWER